MESNENPRPLSVIVGERLRKFRESRGLRQEDVADAARSYGFTWGRSSVAALEAGNRELSLGELLLLPTIVRRLGGWSEPIIPGLTEIMISESKWIPAHQMASHVLALLAPTATPDRQAPERERLEEETLLLGGIDSDAEDSPRNRRRVIQVVSVYEYMYYMLWPERLGTYYTSSPGSFEVNRRVAERITTPDGQRPTNGLVEAFALGLYGRTLGEERDARADERGTYETKRALQSARGHVTRELIDELQAEITRRWEEVEEVISKTNDAIATDAGLAEWDRNYSELADRWAKAAYEADRQLEVTSKRRRFFRSGR
ncbi:helix-turn-helix domain-containing protein [Streptomyces sp. NPDC090493]|uniref:helix-turn-helix domain-containing protein n=1 Tax=Streptomyces sp. NPDC090493 TaxID=3365964 RepID=UPI00381BF30A